MDLVTGADVWGAREFQAIDDAEWISWAARNGCAGLTADEKIRYRHKQALVSNQLQVFCFPHNNLLIAEQVRRVLVHAERMRQLVAAHPGPWLATLYEANSPDGVQIKWRE